MKRLGWLLISCGMTMIAVSAQADSFPNVDAVKVFREDGQFETEISFQSDWRSPQVDVTFLNETVQIDLPEATFTKGKQSIRTADKYIRSVYTYQPRPDVVRVRLILKKGLAAQRFENSIQINREGQRLRLILGEAAENLTGLKNQEILKSVMITDLESTPASAPGTTMEAALSESPKLVAGLDSESQENKEAVEATSAEAKIAENMPEEQIPVLSKEKVEKKSETSPVNRLLTMAGVFTLILGGTWLGVRNWAKKSGKKFDSTKIQTVTQHFLGPKKSLAIVRVAGEHILIGVTDHNISMIKTLSLIDDEIPTDVPREFAHQLDEMVEQDNFALQGLSDIRDKVHNRLQKLTKKKDFDSDQEYV